MVVFGLSRDIIGDIGKDAFLGLPDTNEKWTKQVSRRRKHTEAEARVLQFVRISWIKIISSFHANNIGHGNLPIS